MSGKENAQQVFQKLLGDIKKGLPVEVDVLKGVFFKENGKYYLQLEGEQKKRIPKNRFRAELHAEATRRVDPFLSGDV